MRRLLVVTCALAVVLGGCGRGGETTGPAPTIKASNTASSPSPKVTAQDAEVCTLLTSKERRSIAGVELDVVKPAPVPRGFRKCLWIKSFSSASTTLEATTASAQGWARTAPAAIDGVIASGRADGDLLKRLLDAKKTLGRGTDKLSDEEACGMFSLLAEADGRDKGATETFTFRPSARTCTDGVYTQVTYTQPGLERSGPAVQAALRLMRIAHERAIKLS